MKTVRVKLGKRSYNICIGNKILERLPDLSRKFLRPGTPIFVITNPRIYSLYGKRLEAVLRKISRNITVNKIPDSERAKSFTVYRMLLSKISRVGRSVKPLVVAFGGGVVGDVGGFVASTYRRGVPYIQVPTTLLAQVDSAIGGKVAIDLPQAKNIVGSFYQPKLVLCDTSFLKTLSREDFRNGMAEVIKYGIIRDRGLFDFIEKNLEKIMSQKGLCLERIVYSSARIKASVVEKDELDTKGVRAILNFGHTLGHAIEAAAGYKRAYPHGKAVALGMMMACEVAKGLGLAGNACPERVKGLLKKVRFPARAEGVKAGGVLKALSYDKKFVHGVNRFVLPRRVGKVEVVENIPMALIKEVLKGYL